MPSQILAARWASRHDLSHFSSRSRFEIFVERVNAPAIYGVYTLGPIRRGKRGEDEGESGAGNFWSENCPDSHLAAEFRSLTPF